MRRQVRTERVAFLKRRWAHMLPLAGGPIVGTAWLVLDPGLSTAFAAGAAWAAAVVLGIHLAAQFSGTAPRSVGAHAEAWTAGQLRRLGRGWFSVHDVPFLGSHADHVVIGPPGVFVVETKWSSHWEGAWGRTRLRGAALQALDGVRHVRTCLRAHLGSVPCEVHAVVVLWGDVPDGLCRWRRDAVLLRGRELREWLTHREGDSLTQDQRLEVLAAVRRRITEHHPAPRPAHAARTAADVRAR